MKIILTPALGRLPIYSLLPTELLPAFPRPG